MNTKWTRAFRVKDIEDGIAKSLGICVPRAFLHPYRMLFAMALEKPQSIRLELATTTTPTRPGRMSLNAARKGVQFTLFCKIEAHLGSMGMEEVFRVTKRVEAGTDLLKMMTDVKAVFVRHRLKMTRFSVCALAV